MLTSVPNMECSDKWIAGVAAVEQKVILYRREAGTSITLTEPEARKLRDFLIEALDDRRSKR